MTVTIRSAKVADHSSLTELFVELDRFHLRNAPWLLQPSGSNFRPISWLESLLVSPDSSVLVADSDGCVGLATVHLRHAPSAPFFIQQSHAVIDDLIVHRNWRRQGIASKLYQACSDWSITRNARWLEVNVYDFNSDAERFYASLGFEPMMRKMRKPFHK